MEPRSTLSLLTHISSRSSHPQPFTAQRFRSLPRRAHNLHRHVGRVCAIFQSIHSGQEKLGEIANERAEIEAKLIRDIKTSYAGKHYAPADDAFLAGLRLAKAGIRWPSNES